METTVQTFRTIPNNEPDIVIRENEKGMCRLKYVAISGDRSVIKTETEKIFQKKSLTTKIQHTWNVITKLVPEITGATGSTSKSFRKYLSNIPANTKSQNYRKQPYWAVHTYCVKH